MRMVQFDALRNSECGIDCAWERDRKQDQGGLVLLNGFKRQNLKPFIHQGEGRSECLRQGLEAGLAARQGFSVSHKFKP